MTRHATRLAVAACTIAIAVAAGAGLAAAGAGRLSVTPAAGMAAGDPAPAPLADPATVVEVGLTLAGRDPDGLRAFLAAIGDPASPSYRATIPPAAFGDRFGLDVAREDALVATLAREGLTVVRRFPQRTSLVARGTAADIGRLFGVGLEVRTDPRTGERYVAADRPPVVPPLLAGAVTGVTGLDPWLARAAIDPADAPPPADRGLKPRDLALAYEFAALADAGFDGTGQTVAILQYGIDTDDDLAVFDAAFGLSGPRPERIAIGDGLVGAPDDFAGEAALDTQVVRGTAPGAQILVYGLSRFESMATGIDAIVADGRASIVTVSYGKCLLPGEYILQDEVDAGALSFAAAAAAGVSIFASSGDTGAYTCHMFDPADDRPTVIWPSCTGDVISVGGTYLETRDDGTWLRETGWQDYLVTAGGGGGINPDEDRRPWQTGSGLGSPKGMTRVCPDVSAAADPDTGYQVFATDPVTGEPGWATIGGTSAASPLWAGITAIVAQVAASQGRGLDGEPGRLGFLAPTLYAVAADRPDAFHDIVRGGNLLDEAVDGWDLSTGLGSPRVGVLADAIAASLPEVP